MIRSALLVFLMAASCPLAAAAGDRVVARVGSEAVTAREVQTGLEQNPELSREKVLDLLLERRLILSWAAARNITASEEEIARAEESIRKRNDLTPEQFEEALAASGDDLRSFRTGLREQITINKALGAAIGAQTVPSEEEVRAAYEESYPVSNQFRISHILLGFPEGASEAGKSQTLQKAEDLLRTIREGASFEEMAREYSQDTSSAGQGGSLGTFLPGEILPELERAVRTLKPGEIGGPVLTTAGYHLLRLDALVPTQPPPLAEVRAVLERRLGARKETDARERWLQELKAGSYIEIFPDGG